MLNRKLLYKLEKFDKVYIAGEAKSHCVSTSVKQIVDNIEANLNRVVILEDAMSPVPGFETIATPIYKEAKRKGVEFSNTTDWVFASIS